MREAYRLKVFENKIFGPKGDGNGNWRKLYYEELHHLFHSLNILRVIKSRRLRWISHAARMEDRKVFRNLIRKPAGKRPLDADGEWIL